MEMNPAIWIALAVFVFLQITDVRASHLRFIRQPSNRTVVAGTKKVILNCYVENFQGKIGWNKDGFVWQDGLVWQDGASFSRYSIAESDNPGEQNLKIANVSVEDDGLFNCQVRTSRDKLTSRDVYLTVIVPPASIVISPSVKRVITIKDLGHEALRCQATRSKPRSTIRWRIGGVEVANSENKVVKIPDSKLVTTSSVYHLSPSRAQNGTLVECLVGHEAYTSSYKVRSSRNGEETATAVLNVIYPPNLPFITGHAGGSIVAGSTIVLTCTSTGGNPLATLTWTLDGVVIFREYNHHDNMSTSELRHVIKAEDNNKMVTCLASNRATINSLVESVKLSVLFPPSDVQVSQHPVGAVENSSLSLTCRTTASNPPASIAWFRNGSPVSESRSFYKYTISKSTFSQSVLTLNNVKRDDASIPYVCAVTIHRLHYVKEVSTTLEIYYPPLAVAVEIYYLGKPMMSASPSLRLLEEGKTVQFKCIAMGGNPPPTLSWYKDGLLIAEDDDVIQPGSAMTYTEEDKTISSFEVILAAADNGRRYECTATNQASAVPIRQSQTLQVLFAPSSLTIEQSPLAPVSGHPMSLICRTSSSNPKATITWLRNGNPISSEHPSVVTTIPGRHGGFICISRLTITPTQRDHGMVVTCNAENGILKKSVNKDIAVNVEFSPYFESESFRFNATEGEDSFVVFIPAVANPANMTYRWWRLLPVIPGGPLEKIFLEPNGRFSTSIHEGILRIQSIKKQDTGIYVMEATNPRGSAEVNVTIDVLYPPSIVDVSGPSMASVGDNVTLRCKVENHPLTRLTIRWMKESPNEERKNFDVISSDGDSVLRLGDVTASDRGVYACVASNGVGEESKRSFSLKILFGAIIDRQETPGKVAQPEASSLPAHVSLPCTASGNPGITFQWRTENGSVIHEGSSSEQDSLFTIDHVTHGDDVYTSHLYVKIDQPTTTESSYSCGVNNVMGKDAIEIKLVPRGHPDPPHHISVSDVTFNSISLSWQPGFDGGTLQTFLLQYKLLSSDTTKSSTKTNDWVEINVAPLSQSFKLDGFVPSSKYAIRMRSKNSFGYSDFSPVVEVATAADSATPAGTTGGATFDFVPVVATFSIVIFLLLVLLAVFLIRRRHSSRESYQPKSITTETISLPTPASSLTGSEGSSTNRREGDRSSKTYLPSSSNSGPTSGVQPDSNRADGRLDGSGQSLNHDMSRVAYVGDGMSGRSELSNCSMSVGQHRSGKFSPSSRDTSFSSLAHDDVNRRDGTTACLSHPEQTAYNHKRLWTNKSYEDIELHSVHPRRVNSVSAADCLRVAEVAYIDPNADPSACGHQKVWEASCEHCIEERRQHNAAIMRRGSETMRSPKERKQDGRRVYHTMSMNAGRQLRLSQHPDDDDDAAVYYDPHPSNREPLCHLFQPRGARFCGMKVQPNFLEKDYSPSVASGSSLGYRSGQDQCSEEMVPTIPQQDDDQLHGQFFVPNSNAVSGIYADNIHRSSPLQIPATSQGCSTGGLYVLGVNEGSAREDTRYPSPGIPDEDVRLKALFLQDCARLSNQNPHNPLNDTSCYKTRIIAVPLHLNLENKPVSSSNATHHLRPQCVTTSQQPFLSNNRDLYDVTTSVESSKCTPHEAMEGYSGSSASTPSSAHPLISVGFAQDKNVRGQNGTQVSSMKANLKRPTNSEINRSGQTIPSSYSASPQFLGVDEEGTLFV